MNADRLLAEAAHLEATATARRTWADMGRRNAAAACHQPPARIAGFKKLAANADLQADQLQAEAKRLRAEAAALQGDAHAVA